MNRRGFLKFLGVMAAGLSLFRLPWSGYAAGVPVEAGLAADTWYHAFAFTDPATGELSYGFDTSLAAENLVEAVNDGKLRLSCNLDGPGRRVAAVLTDSSGDIVPFEMQGDVFTWENSAPFNTPEMTGETAGFISPWEA